MTAVSPQKLRKLYDGTDDPWAFRTSEYEQAKFRATRAALPRRSYASGLEIGCGNGELARHLAPLCDAYHGVDAVETALAAARLAVPRAGFTRLFLPADLPDGRHDLIVLSEILYFLDPPGLVSLAVQIDARWPEADVICVSWLGPSGNPIEGEAALACFSQASARRFVCVARKARYRIDLAAEPA